MSLPSAFDTLVDGAPGTGRTLGASTTEKVSFHGVTPVVQASAIVAVGTSVPVVACATYGLTSTQLTALITATNSIITVLQAKGLTA